MLFLIGNFRKNSLERAYLNAFESIGYSPKIVETRINSKNQFIQKILHRIGPIFWPIINITVLFTLLKSKEKINVVVFKGLELYPNTIKLIARKSESIIHYNPDHPTQYETKISGNSNILRSLKFFDYIVTYSNKIRNDLVSYGLKNVHVIPFAYDSSAIIEDIDKKYNDRICFIGTADKYRAKTVRLVSNISKVDLYGNGWSSYKFNENVTIYPSVAGIEYQEVLRKYLYHLNLFREQNYLCHNMRSFELLPYKNYQLTPLTDLSKYGIDDSKILIFDSDNRLEEICKDLITKEMDKAVSYRDDGLSYISRAHSLNKLMIKA